MVPATTTSGLEKGNPDKSQTSDVPEFAKKLGLEDLNAANNIENMDVDDPELAVETIVGDSAQESLEKTYVQKDVGPDVETSLGHMTNMAMILQPLLKMS